MHSSGEIVEALNEKLKEFQDFSEWFREDLSNYHRALKNVAQSDSKDVQEKVKGTNAAMPSTELDYGNEFRIGFDQTWQFHEEARNWAEQILFERTTFAVDGSLFYAEKEVTLPVGIVRIGWFENPHSANLPYEKNSKLIVLSPKDLLEDQEEPVRPETRVDDEMFSGELARARGFIEKKAGWRTRNEKMPLAFLDRPLLLPFSPERSVVQQKRIDETASLMRFSQEAEVPIIGFVDRGFSRDIINLLEAYDKTNLPGKRVLYDSAIVGAKDGELLKSWGDRTPFCYVKRQGLEKYVDDKTGRSSIGIVFMNTGKEGGAARLDVPAWIFESGLLDEVCEVVRAECVVGVGYPYAIETADQVAVIKFQDRERFLKALQVFAKNNNLNFSVSRKNRSKGRRR